VRQTSLARIRDLLRKHKRHKTMFRLLSTMMHCQSSPQ
jgi:hypothetical protein